MPTELYIPEYAIHLDKITEKQQIRLGLQGYQKVGKTYAALTFPNPVVLDFDRGLGAHTGRAGILSIPFYDDAFVNKLCPKISPEYIEFGTSNKKIRPPNRKDALLKWLYTEGSKFTAEQTLIIDGNTKIQAAYHTEYWTDPAIDKDGKLKPYVEFRKKIDYFTELSVCLSSLKCDIVYICHETDDRTDKGELSGKIRPLMSGAFKDELLSHFTDWFRCFSFEKPKTPDKIEGAMKFFGVDKKTIEEWVAQFTTDNMYLWQTTSDNEVDCGTSTLVNVPKWIPANYSIFNKYRRKIF